jgi:hypothetical protein
MHDNHVVAFVKSLSVAVQYTSDATDNERHILREKAVTTA